MKRKLKLATLPGLIVALAIVDSVAGHTWVPLLIVLGVFLLIAALYAFVDEATKP